MSHQDHATHARSAAGHTALAVIHNYGEDAGTQILRGYLEAFAAAHAAQTDWAETVRIVNAVAAQFGNPDHTTKPRLVVDNGTGREVA